MSSPNKKPLMLWACLPLLLLNTALFVALHQADKGLKTIQARTEETARSIAGLRTQITQAKPPSAASASPNTSAEETSKPGTQGLRSFSDRNVMNDPQFGAPVLRRQRRYAMANYKIAIAALKLAPTEETRLKELIVLRETAEADLGDILDRSSQKTGEGREKLYETITAEADQDIVRLLGAERADQLEANYLQSAGSRMGWDIDTAFWDEGHPLSPAQQTAYTQAQLRVDADFKKNKKSTDRDPLTGTSPKDQAMIEATADFLDPEQRAILAEDAQISARLKVLWDTKIAKPAQEKVSP